MDQTPKENRTKESPRRLADIYTGDWEPTNTRKGTGTRGSEMGWVLRR